MTTTIGKYVEQEEKKLIRDLPVKLGLAVPRILEGPNLAYVKGIEKDFARIGWKTTRLEIGEREADVVIKAVQRNCSGLIVIGAEGINIPRRMDVDGLRPDSFVYAATARGIVDYLEACEFEFAGKSAVVLGRSVVVGRPIAKMLLDKDMTVSVAHSKSDKVKVSGLLQDADLVIAATGQKDLICRGQCWDALVVDVSGIDFEEEDKDKNCIKKVGKLTRLALMKNCQDLIIGQE